MRDQEVVKKSIPTEENGSRKFAKFASNADFGTSVQRTDLKLKQRSQKTTSMKICCKFHLLVEHTFN